MLNSLFKTNEVGELVIIVLSGEYNSAFNLSSHIILGCPSVISTGELKRRISGVCGVDVERLLLLYCGQVLSVDKELIPSEAFELSDAADEDDNSFKARLCLSVLEDSRVKLQEDDDDLDNKNQAESDDVQDIAPKTKHKRKHKDKGEFNLEVELAKISSNAFAGILTERGYDNEGAFANLTLDILRGPGLWIPQGSAQRIHGLCVQRKHMLDVKDKASTQPHYRQIEAHHHGLAAVAEGTGGGAEAVNDAAHHVPVSKADARREYDQEIIRKKKAAKEAAALLKSGKQAGHADSLKLHSEELRKKIEALKLRCAREAEESSSEFDEITGIMYGSYSRLRALNQVAEGGAVAHQAADQSRTAGVSKPSTALGAKPSSASSSVVTAGPGSPTKLLRAMRSSASQPSLVHIATPSDRDASKYSHFPPEAICDCCAKHSQSVQANRQGYVARRRMQHTVELRVALARLPPAPRGFVTRATLTSLAAQYLRRYRGMPQRSADPALVARCIDASRLTLREQRETVLWVQGQEAREENLLSVVPVTWHSAPRFICALVNLLEELDSERLCLHEDADDVVYQDVPDPFLI